MKKLLIIFFSLSFHYANAQVRNIDSLYVNYFEKTREIPYLHLNKTTFLKGEDIWFQSYVFEQNLNKLHPTTSNLYVSIFDELGNQKEQHLIHIKNGVGYGNITIDSTFNKENYYIKASTNWMRNFNEDNSFIQKISILTDQNNNKTDPPLSSDAFYEFKLFPEGGHLLANTINNIGILVKDANNKGLKIDDGKIKNDSGVIIGQFTTNALGFANVNIPVKSKEIYSFEVTLPNGTTLTEKTSLPDDIGITLNTKILDDYCVLNFLTNNASLEKLNTKRYRVLIHNTRNFKNYFFNFNNKDKTYAVILQKKELPKGIIIVTIFNEDNVPVIERLLFNEFEDFSKQLLINTYKVENDSMIATLTNNSSETLVLSSSFLPAYTKACKPAHSIITQTILKPYIKGVIENPQYYFNNSKQNYKDLDLLLLTQGWSKYSWDNIYNNPPKNNFNFEQGIDIKIHLNKPLREKQSILVFSPKNNILRELSPNNDPYVIKNSFIKKQTDLQFSLKQSRNPLQVMPVLSYSNSKILDHLNPDYLRVKYSVLEDKELISPNINIDDFIKDTEVLDEVVIVGKKKHANNATGYSTALRKIDIDNAIYSGYTLIDFLRPIYMRYYNSKSPLKYFYLDNRNITDNLTVLSAITMDEVREVRLGRIPTGFYLGEYFAREVHIFTYSNKEYNTLNIDSITIKTSLGFEEEKEYYIPKYPSYFDKTFKEFGAIYWKPNITIEANSSVNIKLPILSQDKIKIFIEGVSESGELISKKHLTSFNK